MARPADPNARAALVKSARIAFAEHGLLAARIEDITHACGLSKGAFYLHFESKEALFQEVVDGLQRAMEHLIASRMEILQRTVDAGRFDAMIELEPDLDVQLLELLWEYRDVIAVLMRGSQGTRFQTLIWEMVDGEVRRAAEQHRSLQGTPFCRSDVPPEVFGTVIVGTYLLLGQQMVGAKEKPDFRSMAQAVRRLIHEGSIGRVESPQRAPASRPDRRAAPRARNRKTPSRVGRKS